MFSSTIPRQLVYKLIQSTIYWEHFILHFNLYRGNRDVFKTNYFAHTVT
jgi:hypothetical protein